MSCKHEIKPGETVVWIGTVTPPPYRCSFCEMERLQTEVIELKTRLGDICGTKLAPPGWYCRREPHPDGPCAALPLPGLSDDGR